MIYFRSRRLTLFIKVIGRDDVYPVDRLDHSHPSPEEMAAEQFHALPRTMRAHWNGYFLHYEIV